MVQLSKTQFTFTALIIITILCLESVELVRCDRYYGKYFSTMQLRDTKPRSTRGFKTVALSTARGFGKRNSPAMDSLPEVDPYDQQFTPQERFAAISLLLKRLLQNDPEAMKMIFRKSSESDHNQGHELTPYEQIRRSDSRFGENTNAYEEH